MNILTFRHPAWFTNCYLLFADGAPESILIDAGAPLEYFADDMEKHGLELRGVFLTHHHGDHTTHLGAWMKHHAPQVFGHAQELSAYGIEEHKLSDGDVTEIGEFRVKALLTPGHTEGHFCFLVNDAVVFTGDTLFRGSVGSTVAKGHGSFEQLKSSVMNRILSLPAHTVIYPGHAEPTSVRRELEKNPFARVWAGKEIPNSSLCKVGERDAELILLADDYDGGKKAWITFVDETGNKHEEIVPGSWIDGDSD